jgi:hypothetical protein
LHSAGPSIVDTRNNIELVGKQWNFSSLVLGKFLDYAGRPGFSQLSQAAVAKVLPQIFSEPKVIARANANGTIFELSLTNSEGPSTGFSSEDTAVVYFSPDGRAFSALGLSNKVVFNSGFRATRFENFAMAAWVWTAVNSRLFSEQGKEMRDLASRLGIEDQYFDVLGLPDMPVGWKDKLPEVISLMEQVSAAAKHASYAGSIVRATRLETGRKWRLRGSSLFDSKVALGKPLEEYISECRSGRSIDVQDYETEIPVYDSKWLRTGKMSKFTANGDESLVLAQPGDVITPKTGVVSRGREVSAPGAVDANGIILTPKGEQEATELLAFLNSTEASDQRLELCDEGSIVKKISTANLKRMIVLGASSDVEKTCAAIVGVPGE